MNGFVLHANNYLRKSVFHKKNSFDCGQATFLQQSIHKNLGHATWHGMSKRDMQLLHYFKTWKLHGPV